jgi:hypothetical protein
MRPTTEHYLKKDLAKRAGREVPRSGGVAPPGGPSPSSPDDPRPRIGARVRIEGVVMGRQKYGVNVRLPDGTIQGFSNVAVSPARGEVRVVRLGGGGPQARGGEPQFRVP